jgi:hypothetical protein
MGIFRRKFEFDARDEIKEESNKRDENMLHAERFVERLVITRGVELAASVQTKRLFIFSRVPPNGWCVDVFIGMQDEDDPDGTSDILTLINKVRDLNPSMITRGTKQVSLRVLNRVGAG